MEMAGAASAWIACPESAVPVAGAYVLASEEQAVLPTALFLEASAGGGFIAAPPIPRTWEPGMRLDMRGPLGHGFHLPEEARHVCLATIGETASRLLPLAEQALHRAAAVALFTDIAIANLSSAIEVNPLSALPDALSWADFLALDLPLERLPELSDRLGFTRQARLPCPGQALLWAPMPCGGMADCGVCAVQAGRNWKLICKDGPVFDLEVLIP